MKTIPVLMMALTGVALSPISLRAEEAANEMKCSCMKADVAKKPEENKTKCSCMKTAEAKRAKDSKVKEMQQKMEAKAAEFDKLLDEMNASTGEKKVEAMAAIINKMSQKHKEMHAKVAGGKPTDMTKKDGKPEGKPGEVEYYTCKMHPQVHWPVPGKCPLCSMEFVPVFKKDLGAKPGEEIKKAEDPHAGHQH